ncbi:MAG: hypothetical protein JST94_03180 [Bacteroidetes bacterium]|nr:hypothetical protein [Bacteroidota bacterium]MBS1670441.1 hypothetical protein [Bacteroidota bacterium]
MENEQLPSSQPNNPSAQLAFDKEKITGFYKKNLPEILKTFFTEPIAGNYSLLSSKNDNNFFSAMILIISTAVLYILLPYLMLGDAREYVGFGTMLKIGICVALLLIIITALVFSIKSISGKPVFKNELLTGALCGIPLSFLLLIIFILKLFSKNLDPQRLAMGDIDSLQSVGVVASLIVLYVFLMLINTIQQSLKSGGTKDALAWYLSPVTILLAIYITIKLAKAFIA